MARGRPRKALLSRDMIVETALRQIDAGEDLNMSKVARELGVHVSSLYNHVEDRDGLLEEIRLHIAHEYPMPPLAGLSWQDTIRAVATTIHTAYAAHPRLVAYLATVPSDAREITSIYVQLTDVMFSAGHRPETIAVTLRMINTLSMGTAMITVPHSAERALAIEGWRSVTNKRTLVTDELALINTTFEWGLTNLVTGLEAELAATQVA